MSEFYDRGELPPTVQMHQRVATHHGIPALNLGRAIWEEIHTGNATWQEMLPDNTHPSDQGFAINTAQIRAFLEAHRNDAAAGPREVPPLTVDPLEQAHLVEVTGVDAPSWRRDDEVAGKYFPHSITASTPGTELHYSFEGTAIGLFQMTAPDSGDIEWSVDGAAPRRASSWDRYALLRFTRKNYAILVESLPPGRPELTVRVLGQHNTQSEGAAIRIGWFLVNGPPAKP